MLDRPALNGLGFDQLGQVGLVLDQFLDPGFELHLPDHADLEAEVTQSTAQVVLNGNGFD
jgi:hypothetical protein